MKICKVLIAVVAFFSAAKCDLLGLRQCTYGPSYWCDSLANAKECSAVSHCRENSWGSSDGGLSLSSNNTACDYCKDLVSDVKNFIESNKTVGTISDYMKKACDFMPDDFSKTECNQIWQHYLEEFLDIVEYDVDANMICQLVFLCPRNSSSASLSGDLSELKDKLSTSSNSDDDCDKCKAAVATVRSDLDKPEVQEALKELIEKECQSLGTDLAAECSLLVHMGFSEVIQLVEQELTDQLCVVIHVCPSNSVTLPTANNFKLTQLSFSKLLKGSQLKSHITGIASRIGSDACTTCEEVINYIKLFVNNNGSEAAVQELFMNEICPQLGELSGMCKEIIEQYFPLVWDRIRGLLDPKAICTELSLCSNTSVAQSAKADPIKRVKSGVECVLCEFIMDKIAQALTNNATTSEIVHAVEEVCAIMPATIKGECKDMIEKYGTEIIEALIKGATPSIVCDTVLGLCSASLRSVAGKAGPSNVNMGNCAMCKLGINYVKNEMPEGATEDQIMALLEEGCNRIPGSYSKECKDMVAKYGHQICQMLLAGDDATTICTKLGACSGMLGKADGLVHLYSKLRAANV